MREAQAHANIKPGEEIYCLSAHAMSYQHRALISPLTRFKVYEPQTLDSLLHNLVHCFKTSHLFRVRRAIIVSRRISGMIAIKIKYYRLPNRSFQRRDCTF